MVACRNTATEWCMNDSAAKRFRRTRRLVLWAGVLGAALGSWLGKSPARSRVDEWWTVHVENHSVGVIRFESAPSAEELRGVVAREGSSVRFSAEASLGWPRFRVARRRSTPSESGRRHESEFAGGEWAIRPHSSSRSGPESPADNRFEVVHRDALGAVFVLSEPLPLDEVWRELGETIALPGDVSHSDLWVRIDSRATGASESRR